MDVLKFVLFVALAGLFIILILWMVGGCNCISSEISPKSEIPINAKKHLIDPHTKSEIPINTKKHPIDPHTKSGKKFSGRQNNKDVAQRSYYEMTNSLFDLIDGKDNIDVQVNITANISLFADTLCANCDSDESKVLQTRFIVAIQRLLDIQDKELDSNSRKLHMKDPTMSDIVDPKDSEDLTSQDLSPTPSGSCSGSSSQELTLAKGDIAEISKSLARSYSKCIHLNEDTLNDFFVTSAAYISSYKKYSRNQPEKAANIRKAHNIFTRRLHVSKIDRS